MLAAPCNKVIPLHDFISFVQEPSFLFVFKPFRFRLSVEVTCSIYYPVAEIKPTKLAVFLYLVKPVFNISVKVHSREAKRW